MILPPVVRVVLNSDEHILLLALGGSDSILIDSVSTSFHFQQILPHDLLAL